MRCFLAVFLCSACADMAYSDVEFESDTAANVPAQWGARTLRLDVHAASGGDDRILNQSFLLSNGVEEDLNLSLATPVELSGLVTGRSGTPYPADVDVPGVEGPVDAVIRATVPGTIMSYGVSTDEWGEFNTAVVPAAGYNIAIVPTTDPRLPFEVITGVTISGDTQVEVSLGLNESFPVYGRILDGLGAPISELQVRLIEQTTGFVGPTVLTDRNGVYNLRVLSGAYSLYVEGDPQRGIPTLETPVLMVSADIDGLEVNEIRYGHTDLATVSGEITGVTGAAGEVLVRIRSVEIEDTPGAAVLSEATTGSNGRFSIRVAPGTYSVEIIPSHDSEFSPMAIPGEIEFSAGFTELPIVVLQPRPVVSVQVLDATGTPMVAALIRARELDFNGDTFETYTGPGGTFSMQVSESLLQWTIIPANPKEGAITFSEAWPQDLDGGVLSAAEGVSLSGCVTWQGDSLPFTLVEARDADNDLFGSAITDQSGCFHVRVDWDETP